MSALDVRQLDPTKAADRETFLRAGDVVFAGDPAWVTPLRMVMHARLDPKKDPMHKHAEIALFVAERDGALVGRVSATVDRTWLDVWKDETGHFGYFDTLDDEDIARALLARAEAWLRERGMKRVNGPMSLIASQELGLLVEGFEHPPVIDMAHSRPWQARLAEACGYTKEKDVLAYRFERSAGINARTQRAWEQIKASPEIRLRSIDRRNLRKELGVVMEIYNETWAGKWAWIPVTSAELDQMAEDLSLVLDPDLAFMADIDGQTAGMCIMIPNLNEVISDLGGALFPFGWAKLLWRTKVSHPKSARLILLGVREQFRKNVKRYGGLSAAMYVEVAQRGMAKGYDWAELSWIREDDAPIMLGIRSMGAQVYKRYRVLEKRLSEP